MVGGSPVQIPLGAWLFGLSEHILRHRSFSMPLENIYFQRVYRETNDMNGLIGLLCKLITGFKMRLYSEAVVHGCSKSF